MEYIKKEELIIGEIYYVSTNNFWMIGLVTKSNNGDNSYDSFRGNATYISKDEDFNKDESWCYEAIGRIYRLASSEEKHWLNECIKLDKFITFEEAMKTFIPEYVECTIQYIQSAYKLGIIYKVSDTERIENSSNGWAYYRYNQERFKPSTKEAYDAQFIVKEPEFVLPEKWCIKRNAENDKIITDYINKLSNFHHNYLCNNYNNPYLHNKVNKCCSYHKVIESYKEITFDQFKKYVLEEEIVEEKVIEPLPQFKVIETIETITKVENNEGNQFFIGDVVKSFTNHIHKIEGFKYNVDKTNILAITNKSAMGVNIDKIEHYIEPKTDYEILEYKTENSISCKAPFLADSHQFYINERCKIYSIKRISDDLIITVGDEVLSKTCGVPNKILSIELINNKIRLYPRNSFYNLEDIIKVKEETLLEKAKRLYPIGTKFIPVMRSSNIPDISIGEFRENNGNIFHRKDGVSIFFENKWAEIIK